MKNADIVANLKLLFGEANSPGQAFDALVAMRRDGVTWADAVLAVQACETSEPRPPEPRRRELLARPARPISRDEDENMFPCPGCGVARSSRDYCINPACSEHKPNPETARIQRKAPPRQPSAFKNPRLGFGPYAGKTLSEVLEINPGYVAELTTNTSPFWAEQARLVQLKAEVEAPLNRDVSDTGYFG